MGVSYNPRIVTDGLVFCVDAANKRSYPGTGTTWTDLKGGNNGSLINTPTYNSDNGGGIVCDGSNQYISTSLSANSQFAPHTMSFIFKTGTISSDMRLFGAGAVSSDISQTGGGWTGTTFRLWTYGWTNTSFTTTAGTIYHLDIVSEYNGDYENRIYVNGEYNSLAGGRSWYSSMGFGARFLLQYGASFNGTFYKIATYSKALTADEVLQNYNATKGRYE